MARRHSATRPKAGFGRRARGEGGHARRARSKGFTAARLTSAENAHAYRIEHDRTLRHHCRGQDDANRVARQDDAR
jgi:hypothetical protein